MAMMLKYGLGEQAAADRIEKAVVACLEKGYRSGDIAQKGEPVLGCIAIGEKILAELV